MLKQQMNLRNETNLINSMTIPIRYLILCAVMCVTLAMPSTTHDLSHDTPKLTKQEQQRIIQEYNCNKEVLWFESRSEGLHGLKAVMSVVYHRTKHKSYPSSFCAVIQQKFQFSYRNHLRKGQMMQVKRSYNAKEQQIVLQVQDIAFRAATDRFESIFEDGVVMYHASYMKKYPAWSQKFKKYATIGQHIFYKNKRE